MFLHLSVSHSVHGGVPGCLPHTPGRPPPDIHTPAQCMRAVRIPLESILVLINSFTSMTYNAQYVTLMQVTPEPIAVYLPVGYPWTGCTLISPASSSLLICPYLFYTVVSIFCNKTQLNSESIRSSLKDLQWGYLVNTTGGSRGPVLFYRRLNHCVVTMSM